MNNEYSIQSLLDKVMIPQEESIDQSSPGSSSEKKSEIIDLGNDFDFEGFQVVRREFFAHLREPSATFCDFKFSVNSACLKKFPGTNSVQALINQERKIMVLMPCEEEAKDSFVWCSLGKKRGPKAISCRLFCAKVIEMMDWNPSYRYKVLGKLIRANGQELIAFDLNDVETYQRTDREGKISRKPVYPEEWKNQFGLPYSEHAKSMQVNIVDGFAIYSLKDNKKATTNGEPQGE